MNGISLRYRYIELRKSYLQRTLRLRHDLVLWTRNYLASQHRFMEVETPTLFKSTPEGG